MTITDVDATSVAPLPAPTPIRYLTVDVVIQGTARPFSLLPQEVGVRTRVEGMSTDSFRTVDVSAIDIDCHGISPSASRVGGNFPVEPGIPASRKGPLARALPTGRRFLPAYRTWARDQRKFARQNEERFTYSEYQLPSSEFIFPENVLPESAAQGNFSDMLSWITALSVAHGQRRF